MKPTWYGFTAMWYKMIEIDLQKLERGLREGMVTVRRGGKVFQRKQRLGVKEKPKGEPKEKVYEDAAGEFFNKYKETEQGRRDLECLYHYSSAGYRRINPYLISGVIHATTTKDELDSVIKDIKIIIGKAPKYEGVVYRGMQFREKGEFDNFLSRCKEGKNLLMKNFVSTSTDKDIASEFTERGYSILYTIKSKKGVFLDGASPNLREKEVLFNNESEFKISNIKKISDNKFEIIMEEI